jgi:hypothetical protein
MDYKPAYLICAAYCVCVVLWVVLMSSVFT